MFCVLQAMSRVRQFLVGSALSGITGAFMLKHSRRLYIAEVLWKIRKTVKVDARAVVE